IVFLYAVSPCVVLEVDFQVDDASIGRTVLGPGHFVLLVVAVAPGLGEGALALLRLVAFGVVAVGPGAVARKAVAGPGSIAAVVAVAGAVVSHGVRAIGGQLAGVVVDVARRRGAVAGLGRDPSGVV